MSRRSRPRRLLLVLAFCTGLAACGTTVPVVSRTQVPELSSGQLPSAPLGHERRTANGVAPAGGSGGDNGLALPGDGTEPLAGGSTASPSTLHDVRDGIGITATTVSVGFIYAEDAEAAYAAVGADSLTPPDRPAQIRAVIDDVNRHGGVAGRRLVPVFHSYDAQTTETGASLDQAACSAFTQDHKVFAVVASGFTNTLRHCLLKAGVLQVWGRTLIGGDLGFYRAFPHYIDLGAPNQDRMMSDLVRVLVRRSYFSGWDTVTGAPAPTAANIGILSVDLPEWNRPLERLLLPALTRAGHPVDPVNVYRVTPGDSSADRGTAVAAVQNAVLRFQTEGVTHVIILGDPNGNASVYFTQFAKSQRYFPRFGVNSTMGMQALADAKLIDPEQLRGAVGVGWNPPLDLPADTSSPYATAATRHCLDVMAKAQFHYTSTNAASIALSICDEITLVATAARNAGRPINLSTALGAVDRLGGSFPMALVVRSFLAPARHDAVELGYDMVWDGACGCARYLDRGHSMTIEGR